MIGGRLFQRVFWIGVLFACPFVKAEVQFQDIRIWTRARNIEPGQQIWSFQTSYQKITDRFSNQGELQPLGQAYNRAVTWREILESESSVRAEMEEYMREHGAVETDLAALAEYEVEREEIGFRLAWAYGLLRRWMIGFEVPLTRRETFVRSKVSLSPQLNDFSRRIQASGGDVKQKIKEISERQLANSGYDEIPDRRSSWDWGDITLLSQFGVVQTYSWHWSLQQMLRFPTARNQDIDEYIQTSDDTGQVDIGLVSLLDYQGRAWTTGFRTGYIAQLPDTTRWRISDADENRRIDPQMKRDLGDWWFASLDFDYRYSSRLHLNLESSYLMKASDRFSSTEISPGESTRFERNTEQEIVQTRFGAQYEIHSGGTRAGISKKWIASVGYNYPWIGRNSLNASRASIDLITYY